MKKGLLLLGAAALIFGATSCKKDYTCKCTYDILGTEYEYEFEINDAKKSDAEDLCTYDYTDSSCELE